jgi:tetratricopeptide (TPR) repeat protein
MSLAAADPGQAGSAAGAPALKADAAVLFARLYPEVDTPFTDVTASPAIPAGVGPFLKTVLPALELLPVGASIDQPRAASLDTGLAAADALNPRSVLPPYLRALLVDDTRPADARALYEEALRRDPGFYPAARQLSALIIAGGSAAQDLPRLEELAALLPTPAARFDALARAELAGGQPQRAADAAAQGLLAAPDQAEFVLLRAQALENLGDWYQSLWILDALLKVSPDRTDAIALKARLLHDDEQNSPEALRVLDDAEARFPNDPSFPELRGRILLATGQDEDAVTALKRSLSLDPARMGALSLLLEHAVGAVQWNDAEGWLARIPDASRSVAILRLGWQAEEGLGNHDQAITYARAIGTGGNPDEAQEREIRSLIAAGRAPDALAMADKGIAAASDPSVRSTFRALRAAAGSADPLSDLRQALLDNPRNGEALSAIADLFAAQGDLRKAAEFARSAASLDPQNAALAAKAAGFASRADSGN